MPQIDFCFQGWVRGAEVNTATRLKDDGEIEIVDVRNMPAQELVDKLNKYELCVSLGDHLYDNKDASIEIHDFEEVD